MNIDGIFQRLVGLGATWVLWVLVGLSVLALAVMLERLVYFVGSRGNEVTLREAVSAALKRHDLARLKANLAELRAQEARIVEAGLDAICPEEAIERMGAEAQFQRLRSERNLAFLGTLGNNAPFVGLLGTVVGIIGAFGQLDASGGQLTTGLMTEIGEALIATGVGLLVALPSVAAYNAFQRTIQVRLSRADALGRELVAHLHAVAHGAPPKTVLKAVHALGGE